ncbi:MAG: hypothetical protein ACXVPN_10335 [Bacteroidia bacterium]
MKKTIVFCVIWVILLFVNCSGNSASEDQTTSRKLQIQNKIIGKTIKEDISLKSHIEIKCDTSRLLFFWASFRKYLKNDDIDSLSECFDLPLKPLPIHMFRISAECDTNDLTAQFKLYDTLNITNKNFRKYYPILFTKFLKNLIQHYTGKKILEESESCADLQLRIYPKDSPKFIPCETEHMLIFRFILDSSKGYKIVVDGL